MASLVLAVSSSIHTTTPLPYPQKSFFGHLLEDKFQNILRLDMTRGPC